MIDQIKNHWKASTLMNRVGNVITVTLENQIIGKEIMIRLLDEEENGNWLVFDYEY